MTDDFVVALDHGIAKVAGLIKSPVGPSPNDMRSTSSAPRHSVAMVSRLGQCRRPRRGNCRANSAGVVDVPPPAVSGA